MTHLKPSELSIPNDGLISCSSPVDGDTTRKSSEAHSDEKMRPTCD